MLGATMTTTSEPPPRERHEAEKEWAVQIAADRAVALLEAGPDMVMMLRRYASECAECGGGGETTVGDVWGNPENDRAEPCGACQDIWELLERAVPEYRYRKPEPPKAVEVPDDDIAF